MLHWTVGYQSCNEAERAMTSYDAIAQVAAMAYHERTALTQSWDDCFGFRVRPIGELCLKYLTLHPDDLVVDVGAGTGNTTESLWKAGILKHSILCVDPSKAMLEGCKLRDGLEPLQATALEFFSDSSRFRHNKVLVVQCVHLWPDLQETFNKMFFNSPENVKCVFVTNIPKTHRAYWITARERFEVAVEPGEPKKLEMALENAGFKVKTTYETVIYTPTKAVWHFNLQNRSTACLAQFSDEEIEQGLKEVDLDFFPGRADEDIVEIKDNVAIIVATKH